MLVFGGLLIICIMMVLILKSQFMPGNVLAMVPLVIALAIGTGFTDTMTFIHKGISNVLVIAALFILATLYFGTMSDAGLFDPIINALTKRIGKTVFSVVATTGLIAMVSHLDGQGITTLLITVPPMLLIFDKMKIRRTLLALVFSTVTAVMNMIPWGGPTARAAAVLGTDVMMLYRQLLPIQILGLVLSFVILYLASKAEEKRGEFVHGADIQTCESEISICEEELSLKRPKLLWANAAITVIVLVALFIGVPSYITFLIGCAVILPLNYRTLKEQNARVKAHAGHILISVYTIIGAGALLGIMGGLGMFEALAEAFVGIIPESLSSVMHIIIGLIITPLGYLLNADAIMYGIMPVIINVGAQYGVESATVAAMFIVGHCIAVPLCLTTPQVYLGLGLMGLDYREAFKANFKWSILLGTALVLATLFIV
ncbi:SLC13 family permease [Geosporobacter ferrireducens]|uniref:SLC13 family permease n=1 Tax=Geosporobacter ferrireducens TaxID=1424294 RepID=UPI00139E092B|nr:SLC13 family permease [Geosporobacter ferrireducens]MTI57631.1 hypothetical protein [Geosporobacter ferrireducens]